MIAMVTAKLSRGRNFPMGSQHRQGQSLNLGPNVYDEGGLDLFSKNRRILFVASSSSKDSCDSLFLFSTASASASLQVPRDSARVNSAPPTALHHSSTPSSSAFHFM
ncbi:hypothetical protein ACFX2C_002470 [Malus domestica]